MRLTQNNCCQEDISNLNNDNKTLFLMNNVEQILSQVWTMSFDMTLPETWMMSRNLQSEQCQEEISNLNNVKKRSQTWTMSKIHNLKSELYDIASNHIVKKILSQIWTMSLKYYVNYANMVLTSFPSVNLSLI